PHDQNPRRAADADSPPLFSPLPLLPLDPLPVFARLFLRCFFFLPGPAFAAALAHDSGEQIVRQLDPGESLARLETQNPLLLEFPQVLFADVFLPQHLLLQRASLPVAFALRDQLLFDEPPGRPGAWAEAIHMRVE